MENKGAVTALLQIYADTVGDLKKLLFDITEEDLWKIRDEKTGNPDCRSIQTIMAHVVYAGFGYATFIQNLDGQNRTRPPRQTFSDAKSYCCALDEVVDFTRKIFETIYDDQLETYEESSKILTGWNQRYDIEQMMEHAIVHILRHHRQIRNFLAR